MPGSSAAPCDRAVATARTTAAMRPPSCRVRAVSPWDCVAGERGWGDEGCRKHFVRRGVTGREQGGYLGVGSGGTQAVLAHKQPQKHVVCAAFARHRDALHKHNKRNAHTTASKIAHTAATQTQLTFSSIISTSSPPPHSCASTSSSSSSHAVPQPLSMRRRVHSRADAASAASNPAASRPAYSSKPASMAGRCSRCDSAASAAAAA